MHGHQHAHAGHGHSSHGHAAHGEHGHGGHRHGEHAHKAHPAWQKRPRFVLDKLAHLTAYLLIALLLYIAFDVGRGTWLDMQAELHGRGLFNGPSLTQPWELPRYPKGWLDPTGDGE